MSTCYYLVETVKKKEFDKFSDFWENTFYQKVKDAINKYFEENQGQLINNDCLEEVMNASSIESLKYCPLSDDSFSSRIGTSTAMDFYWDYISLNLGETAIYDFPSLKKFLDENPSYAVYDEYNNLINIEDFKIITQKKKT